MLFSSAIPQTGTPLTSLTPSHSITMAPKPSMPVQTPSSSPASSVIQNEDPSITPSETQFASSNALSSSPDTGVMPTSSMNTPVSSSSLVPMSVSDTVLEMPSSTSSKVQPSSTTELGGPQEAGHGRQSGSDPGGLIAGVMKTRPLVIQEEDEDGGIEEQVREPGLMVTTLNFEDTTSANVSLENHAPFGIDPPMFSLGLYWVTLTPSNDSKVTGLLSAWLGGWVGWGGDQVVGSMGRGRAQEDGHNVRSINYILHATCSSTALDGTQSLITCTCIPGESSCT